MSTSALPFTKQSLSLTVAFLWMGILAILCTVALVSSPRLVNAAAIDEYKESRAAVAAQANNMSLGSTVFLDENNNGIFDSSEIGIADITISVYDATNTLAATTTTDISGTYLITGLVEGSYYLIIQNPPANAPTSSNVTNLIDDQIDNDDNGDQPGGPGAPVISPIISLQVGDEPLDETGQGGDQDDLLDDSGDMTIDFGFVPTDFTIVVGNYVWDDLNQNGLQDPEEEGLPGVTVALYDTNRGQPVLDGEGNPRTAVTDSVGQFLFTALAPGNYYLVLQDIPLGYQATRQNQGTNDSTDSDLYANVAQTTPTGPLVDGVQYLALDAGLFDDQAGLVADIGDRAWYDHDGDGIQGTNAAEYGLADVPVTLFETTNRSVVQSTTTDADGAYSFVRVPAGNYYLEFSPPTEFLIPVWPSGTNNEALDSDIDRLGRTEVFALVGGQDVDTVDAGFVIPAQLEVNFWEDANQNGLKDGEEVGLNGAQVALVDSSGERLASLLTDADGQGEFTVPPGSYRLLFVAPGGFEFSPTSTASGINNDADADGLTGTVSLIPDQMVTGWDAGVFQIEPSSLFEDGEPVNGVTGRPQNQLSWIYLPMIR